MPSITIDPGKFLFTLEWEKAKNNCAILKFYPDESIQFLFFIPSNNMQDNRSVLQGITNKKELLLLLGYSNAYKNE